MICVTNLTSYKETIEAGVKVIMEEIFLSQIVVLDPPISMSVFLMVDIFFILPRKPRGEYEYVGQFLCSNSGRRILSFLKNIGLFFGIFRILWFQDSRHVEMDKTTLN